MRANPFSIGDSPSARAAPAWLSEDPAKHHEDIPHLLERLLEVAESVPQLYDVLPWLRKMNLWELIVERQSAALFPDAPPSVQEATLLSFFAEVTQPVAEMIEALYLSPLLRERRTVWEILHRMAQSVQSAQSGRSAGAKANTKALPQDVVTGVCASILRKRAAVLIEGIRPCPATWKITWRPTSMGIRWPQRSGCPECPECPEYPEYPQCPGSRQGPYDSTLDNPTESSFVVLVTEETIGEGGRGRGKGRAPRGGRVGVGEQEGGAGEVRDKVLAFRCAPHIFSTADITNANAHNSLYPNEANEALETAMKLALYDALVFPLSAVGRFVWPPWYISPPTHLFVQSPMPKAIRQAASLWRVKAEEIMQPEQQPEQQCKKEEELRWGMWEWERELTGRVLDPAQYLRILDRVCERAYGNAPFLAKQQVVRHLGWHMLPRDDPLMHCPGLGELLPSFHATVGEDGSVEWRGWHYRDYEEDVLRYFPRASVTLQQSPLAEAAVLVYWRGTILCYAVAEELRHKDGSYRPYWFPYPRLGEE